MIVKAIIDNKGRDVLTIEPGASLDNAAKLLAERRIGAVVVLGADDRVVGILSERDIHRRRGEEPHHGDGTGIRRAEDLYPDRLDRYASAVIASLMVSHALSPAS